jgi:hypothetical protein
MNKSNLKILLLVFAAYHGSLSFAHSTGAQSLGSALTAKDIFRVVCFSWGNSIHPTAPPGEINASATHFRAQVNISSGSPSTIRIQALPSGALTSTVSTSPTGNGIHYFVVSHITAGAHLYDVFYDCLNPAEQFTGVGEVFTGNPPNVTPTVDFVRTQNQ